MNPGALPNVVDKEGRPQFGLQVNPLAVRSLDEISRGT